MKTIFNIILTIVLLVFGYAVINQIFNLRGNLLEDVFTHSEEMDLPTVTQIDTVTVTKVIKDTVTITDVEVIYTEKDTILSTEYSPDLEYLKGKLHIACSFKNKSFNIINNLIVENNVITKTIEKPVIIPAPIFRKSAIIGYYGDQDSGIINVGFGIVIKDRIGIYLSGLSNEKLGIQLQYNF